MSAKGATRHLGLDLGGTNIKWAVVEHDDGDEWRVLERDHVATPTADGPEAVVARLVSVGREAIEPLPAA